MSSSNLLLAIDIGNTHVVIGVLDGDQLRGLYRLTSRVGRTSDELVPLRIRQLELSGIKFPNPTHIGIDNCFGPFAVRCLLAKLDQLASMRFRQRQAHDAHSVDF